MIYHLKNKTSKERPGMLQELTSKTGVNVKHV